MLPQPPPNPSTPSTESWECKISFIGEGQHKTSSFPGSSAPGREGKKGFYTLLWGRVLPSPTHPPHGGHRETPSQPWRDSRTLPTHPTAPSVPGQALPQLPLFLCCCLPAPGGSSPLWGQGQG